MRVKKRVKRGVKKGIKSVKSASPRLTSPAGVCWREAPQWCS